MQTRVIHGHISNQGFFKSDGLYIQFCFSLGHLFQVESVQRSIDINIDIELGRAAQERPGWHGPLEGLISGYG